MSRDDFLDAAIEAGVVARDGCGYFVCSDDVDEILNLAALVAAAEREACAQVCESWGGRDYEKCATAIRERNSHVA